MMLFHVVLKMTPLCTLTFIRRVNKCTKINLGINWNRHRNIPGHTEQVCKSLTITDCDFCLFRCVGFKLPALFSLLVFSCNVAHGNNTVKRQESSPGSIYYFALSFISRTLELPDKLLWQFQSSKHSVVIRNSCTLWHQTSSLHCV